MVHSLKSGIAASALALAFAIPAQADITAQELRDEIFGLYEGIGYSVTVGSETMAGGVLTLENVVITVNVPEGGGKVTETIPWIRMTENGGAVDVTIAPTITLDGDVDGDGDQVVFKAHVDMTDANIKVSGAIDDMMVDSSISGGEFALDSLNVDGKDIPLTAKILLGAAESNMIIARGETGERQIEGDATMASLDIAADVQKPGGGGFFTMTGRIADIAETFNIDIVLSDNPEDILNEGFFIDVALDSGANYFDVNFADGDTRFAMTAEADDSGFGMTVSNEVVGYNVSSHGVKMNMSSSDLPFPAVNVGYSELDFSFEVPLATGDGGPQDFHARTALRDLTVNEAVWGMFDPTKSIPRDPATFALDLSGKVMVLLDILSPENIDKLDKMDGPPMLPVSVDLNELLLSFGGALLNGTGNVSFDFANPNMIAGFPAPSGEFNLSLKGAFGLMDKLMNIGLIPADASMGARAMIGAFAKPVGDDHFESKIELGADGSIKANGQRIQ
jgi:hypothetical protein